MGRQDNYNRIIAEVQVILEAYPGITFTLRQMYYRLVAKQLIPNTVNEYKKLSSYLVKARELGTVDDDRFEDRIRKVLGGGDRGWLDGNSFIKSQIRELKKSHEYFAYKQWRDQEEYIEVWLEKDALSDLFRRIADGLNVHTCPARGYPSYSYVMDCAGRILKAGKPAVLLYFGDFDPTGLNIPENLLTRVIKYSGLEEDEITLERVALNIDQIRQYSLPPAPAKRTDARFSAFVEATGSDDVVELDALEPNVLQEMIKRAITEHIDVDTWNRTARKSKRMRKKLKEVFDRANVEIDEVEEEGDEHDDEADEDENEEEDEGS